MGAATFELPRTLTLPSGMRVTLRQITDAAEPPTGDVTPSLFSDAIGRLGRDVVIEAPEGRADVRDLALADFHVLRAVLTKARLVDEEELRIACHNCEAPLRVRPCELLEVGPWEDGELDDPELDVTAELGVPIETAPIELGRVRQARAVTLAPRTVSEASPMFEALARASNRSGLEIDEAFVRAMGVVAIGPVKHPSRIARALAECDDAGFEAVTDAFLDAHYPLRLGADVFCPACKARNTVDAPALREFERGVAARRGASAPDRARSGRLPPLEEFVELAHAIAEPLMADIPGERVELVVEDGTPAVDDGGEPLLGSYVPPPPADAPVPMRPPTVTIYYRTFAAIEREEGPFDWDAELRETIEHELEHHLFYLRGDDPMDEEERAEIAREAVRILGRREATRRTIAVFGQSIPEFLVRAWPLVLIGAAVLLISIAESRCGP